MAYENITLCVEDSIATITINRPKAMNSLNGPTLTELERAFDELSESLPYVVIITGAGKAFVAGADITEFQCVDPEEASRMSLRGQKLFDRIADFPAPVIAAVNGFCLGGGCELAMACDFIYASEKAKFGQPEVKLGLIPGYGGTQRLARRIGSARAKELIYTGRMIRASEALEWGLANTVTPPEELIDTVKKLAKEIAVQAPLAVSYAKKLMNNGDQRDIAVGLKEEADYFGKCFATKDMTEGVAAFLEKRAPNFTRE